MNKATDGIAIKRVLELGTRCLSPDEFAHLERIFPQIEASVAGRTREESPTELTLTTHDLSETRELLAAAYVKLSGKAVHASDCATSNAPAFRPGPCDCAADN